MYMYMYMLHMYMYMYMYMYILFDVKHLTLAPAKQYNSYRAFQVISSLIASV